eukprot:scaffold2103_cov185-Amphora_coffeaeformis.AAC.39
MMNKKDGMVWKTCVVGCCCNVSSAWLVSATFIFQGDAHGRRPDWTTGGGGIVCMLISIIVENVIQHRAPDMHRWSCTISRHIEKPVVQRGVTIL